MFVMCSVTKCTVNLTLTEHIESKQDTGKQQVTFLKNFCKWMDEHRLRGIERVKHCLDIKGIESCGGIFHINVEVRIRHIFIISILNHRYTIFAIFQASSSF